MKTTQKIFLFIPVILFASTSFAQTDSVQQTNKAQFKLGVYYNSTLNYYGRTDSLKSSGFFPMAELWFLKNFYINAAPVFVNNKIQHFEYSGTVATVGYRFGSDEKFSGHFYVVKPFYENSSELVQSALKAQVSANFIWQNKVVNVNVGGDMKFSDKTDYGAQAGLDHVFRNEIGNAVLVISPSAYVYAGTQQFTRSYIRKSGGFLFVPAREQVVSESARKFNILSYEFSVPVVYSIKKLQLILSPAYVIPQNLITADSNPELKESGKEMLYVTIGIKINF